MLEFSYQPYPSTLKILVEPHAIKVIMHKADGLGKVLCFVMSDRMTRQYTLSSLTPER